MRSNDAQTRKAEGRDRIQVAHVRLEQALAALTPEQIEAEGVVGGWSVKATLAHIMWWEQVPQHAVRGEPAEDLLPGEDWHTDRANAVLFARNQARPHRPLAGVLAAFDVSYAELLRELEALAAARLDESTPYGVSLVELIAGNTDRHCDEHAELLAAAFGLALPHPLKEH
jgi:hypothetical protein